MTTNSHGEPDERTPRHVAIIMDGNNRWAQRRGVRGSVGHRAGVEAIRGVLDAFRRRGVCIVTLFAFSSENWQRPSAEVRALMSLFSSYLDGEVRRLADDGVRIRFIGRRDRFSRGMQKQMEYAEQSTRFNRETTLVIAADYGGQWDIANAARALADKVAHGELAVQSIDEAQVDRHVALADLPKPDLCIRTAGEHRISNFLLWQLAYAELYFSDVLWPDFSAADVDEALAAYAGRERRFGGRKDVAGDARAGTGNVDHHA